MSSRENYQFTEEEKNILSFDENEFADDIFEDLPTEHAPAKKKFSFHMIFFAIAGLILIFAVARLLIWNRGEASEYDPTEDTSEFDTEPLDYIQPLSDTQLAGKPDDGVNTILCLGNSTFADGGKDNPLATSLANAMDATILNASFADSYQSQKNATFDISVPQDGISLYEVTKALMTGDFTNVDKAAAYISEDAQKKAAAIKEYDVASADMVIIMYDISDYIDHRPAMDPNDENNLLTYCGALNASINLIQEKYPYMRIVVVSTPASGKTIDNYYVDGNIHDLGNGTLVDYMGHEVNVAISNGVSFIDTFFGVINVDNRNQYIKDDYHLNWEGAKAVSERIAKLVPLTQ